MSLSSFIKTLKSDGVLLPVLRKHLLDEDRKISSGLAEHKEMVIRDAQQTIDCFTERMSEYNHRQTLEGELFHPSQLGGCLRAQFYGQFKAPKDGMRSSTDLLRSALIFEFGTYVHVLFQNLCERAGVLTERESAIVNPKLRIIGHGDGQLLIDGHKYLLEIKTVNDRGFAALQGVKDAHKQQIHAYMKALKLDAAVVVYINKNTSELREYVVNYHEAYYQEHVAKRITSYFDCVRALRLPAREGESPSRMPCSYCDFRRICFDPGASDAWVAKLKHSSNKFAPRGKVLLVCRYKLVLKKSK